jgi:hypothetical protein
MQIDCYDADGDIRQCDKDCNFDVTLFLMNR